MARLMLPGTRNGVGLLTALLVWQACSVGVGGWTWSREDGLTNGAADLPDTAAAPLGAPQAACAMSCCDEQIDVIEQLLHHLELAKQQNMQLRERLLRANHHTPVFVVNPLGGPRNTLWQLATLLAAIISVSALVHDAKGKHKARQLRRQMRDKEAYWRRCVDFLARAAEQTNGVLDAPHTSGKQQVRLQRRKLLGMVCCIRSHTSDAPSYWAIGPQVLCAERPLPFAC